MFRTIAASVRLLDRRDRWTCLRFLILTLMVNSLDVLALGLVGILASIALGDESRAMTSLPVPLGSDEVTLILLLATASIFLLKTGLGLLLARRRQLFLARLETDFSHLISQFAFSAELSRVKTYSKAHLEWIILRSTSVAFGKVLTQAFHLFAEATLAISILVFFVVIDWRTALLVSAYFSLVLAVFQFFSARRSRDFGSAYTSGSIGVGATITDFLETFREISVSSRARYFLSRIRDAREESALSDARQQYLQAVPRLVVELALILGALGFVLIEISSGDGRPDFGVLGIFLFGSLRMMSALLPLQRAYSQLLYDEPQARDAQEVVREVLESELLPSNEIEDLERDWIPTAVTHGLSVKFDQVSFSYKENGEETRVLDHLTFEIPANSLAAFIGPSGGGKSTIIDLMLGLHRPDAGSVRLSGQPPKNLQAKISGIVGYVPQKPGMVSGTIRDNIALGIPKEDVNHDRLWSAIEDAKLGELVRSLPSGPEATLGMHLDSFSGGQLQRIGIARALYSSPRLLVLDEATSALDTETEATISTSLAGYKDEMTIVIVAHRLSTIQSADNIFVIDQGSLVQQGSFSDLSKSVPLVRRYLEFLDQARPEKGQ